MKKKAKIKPQNIVLICLTFLILLAIIYLGYKKGYRVMSISLMTLFAGLFFESFRIAKKWNFVLFVFVVSFLVSLVSFIPGNKQSVNGFEEILAVWPYVFLILYTLVFTIFFGKETTAKIGEGITLIQSLSIIYWVCDYGFINIDNVFMQIGLGICLVFSLFSIVNALSYLVLSRRKRLWLSIWSSIIMVLFSVDNIIRVYSNAEIEQTVNLSEAVYIGMQYFLVGVSAMYMMNNFMMLMGFLPGRGAFFNAIYFKELKQLKKDHIERYSENQIYMGHAIICILLTSGLYYANYTWHWLPVHTAIWIGFVFVPFFLRLDYIRKRV